MIVSFLFSPGRSPVSFDSEIIMMNHVYKERFPKVRICFKGENNIQGWLLIANPTVDPRVSACGSSEKDHQL